MGNEWWREGEVVYTGESDGQQYLCAVNRLTEDGIETAVLLCSDGDGREYVYGGIAVKNGVVVEIPRDR